MTSFAAIDFETADYQRPPRRYFVPDCVELHGINWDMVQHERIFAELWSEVAPILLEVDFVTAHNAPFDISVLNACCLAANITPPCLEVCCTVQLSRRLWGQPQNRLPDVCRHLGIPFTKHHDALADAEACAQIVQHAFKAGWAYTPTGEIS